MSLVRTPGSFAADGGSWHVSYEAEQHPLHQGRAEEPVCWTLCGLAYAREQLASGDVLGFPGNVPHSYQNPDAERSARGISVVVLAKARP